MYTTSSPEPPRIAWTRHFQVRCDAEDELADELVILEIPLVAMEKRALVEHVQYWRAPDWAEEFLS